MKSRVYIFLVSMLLSYLPVFAQVDTAWVRSYNGPGNDVDQATALAVDGSGNVYVTGYSYSGTSYDYATIKYAPNGDTLWVRRYNGPGSSYDLAFALAVDGSGNVYVTGRSYGSGTSADYATIKYAPNGDTLWVRRYNGPSNSYDGASALAIDNSGNVYVTGGSLDTLLSYDYATIKYAPDGDTLWVRRYNGTSDSTDYAYALSVDMSGNVYVTGSSYGSGTSYDYATVKYDTEGDVLWVSRYNGTGNGNDYVEGLAVDDSGNVYVTGRSKGSETSDDYATIKYASNGDTLWIRRFNGPANVYDAASALAVDENGNVYVSGLSGSGGNLDDYATVKYSTDGNSLWVQRYIGSITDLDAASALSIDKNGNLYVTGYILGSGTLRDYATIKYAPNGDTLWVRRYNGTDNGDDWAFSLAVDESNNVYVTGYSAGVGTSLDYITIKYVQFVCISNPGDANGDSKVNLSDIIFKVNYVFKGGLAPSPLCRGDDNADTMVNLTDIIYEVNYVFKGGPTPIKSGVCCF